MISKVFVIYDSKTETYQHPFLMLTKGQAIRAFTDTISDPKTQFAKHPADFTLFEIAEYDDQTGTYTMHKAHISLGTALEHSQYSSPVTPIRDHKLAQQNVL